MANDKDNNNLFTDAKRREIRTGTGQWDFSNFYKKPLEDKVEGPKHDGFTQAFLKLSNAVNGNKADVEHKPTKVVYNTEVVLSEDEKNGFYIIGSRKIKVNGDTFDIKGQTEDKNAVNTYQPFHKLLEDKLEEYFGNPANVKYNYFKDPKLVVDSLLNEVSVKLACEVDIEDGVFRSILVPLESKREKLIYQVMECDDILSGAGIIYKDLDGKIKLYEVMKLD